MVVSGMTNTRCKTYHREVKGAIPLNIVRWCKSNTWVSPHQKDKRPSNWGSTSPGYLKSYYETGCAKPITFFILSKLTLTVIYAL